MARHGMGRISCRASGLLDFRPNSLGTARKFGTVVGCDLKVLDSLHELHNGRSKNASRFTGHSHKPKRNWSGEMLCNFFMSIGPFAQLIVSIWREW